MTTNPPTGHSLRAVLTVTVTSRPDGGHYFDQDDFFGHIVGWMKAGLRGKHAIAEVTIAGAASAAVAVPPPATRAADRDRIRRAICEAEGFAWDSDMLEPDEYGEIADAVLAVLLPPADRAAVLREAADIAEGVAVRLYQAHDVGGSTGAYEVMTELCRMAAEAQQQPDTETPGCWCGHAEDRHWKDQSGRMTFPEGCHDCQGWNGAHEYGQELPWLPEGDEPDAPRREPHPTEADMHHALAVFARFHGRDTATPDDEAPQSETPEGGELLSGVQSCGHDDYHAAHEWQEKPHLWCPGIGHDEPAAAPRPETEA